MSEVVTEINFEKVATSDDMPPDELVLCTHLNGGNFRSGQAKGRWRLLSLTGVVAVISVTAAKRERSPNEYSFRFDCSNYPAQGPTGRLWDAENNTPLPNDYRWPRGKEPQDRFSLAFNPGWKNGEALYLPCDRLSLEGHPDWPSKHPDLIWRPSYDITFYLRIIHDYLRSKYYAGTPSAPV